MQIKTLGFIGLGNMGSGMAANLARAGFRVFGYDPSPQAMARAASHGITAVQSAAAAAAQSDVVLTMLPAAEIVLEVWRQIAPLMRPGNLLVDCSTIDVTSARTLHEIAAAHRLRSVDAPVSGGVGGADAGTLTFMLGGAEDALQVVAPILAHMGRKAVNCGGAGAGQAAKICNNMILGISIVAVSEAFALAEKLGLSHQALFDVASTSSGQCWALTSYCPVPGLFDTAPSNNDYRPGAPATMLLKDLLLSQDAAVESGANTPLGRHATELFQRFVATGHGGEDFSAIIRSLR